MKTTKDLRMVRTDDLIPYQNNARTHSAAQIAKLRASLREFGFVNPIIIDGHNGIIAGHGRWEAAKAEGIEEVPCVLADHLTEAQKKAYILADNRMALDAGWDEELLRIEIESLKDDGFELSLTGFTPKEIESLTDDPEFEDDGFDAEAAAKKEPIAVKGDLWLLGPHRLYVGDSTDPKSYEALMGEAQADLIATDPPYNVAIGSYDRSQDTVLEEGLDNLESKTKKELISIIRSMSGPNVPTTVIDEDKPTRNELHPTMKPIRLMGRLIANSSRKGELVLDPFGGSGSTLIACDQSGRRCATIELDEGYATAIIERYAQRAGKDAVSAIRGGETIRYEELLDGRGKEE